MVDVYHPYTRADFKCGIETEDRPGSGKKVCGLIHRVFESYIIGIETGHILKGYKTGFQGL